MQTDQDLCLKCKQNMNTPLESTNVSVKMSHVPLTRSINLENNEDFQEPILSESINNMRQMPQSSIVQKQSMVASVSRTMSNIDYISYEKSVPMLTRSQVSKLTMNEPR